MFTPDGTKEQDVCRVSVVSGSLSRILDSILKAHGIIVVHIYYHDKMFLIPSSQKTTSQHDTEINLCVCDVSWVDKFSISRSYRPSAWNSTSFSLTVNDPAQKNILTAQRVDEFRVPVHRSSYATCGRLFQSSFRFIRQTHSCWLKSMWFLKGTR